MSALAKRIGLLVIVFDLLVGAASAAVLHHHATGSGSHSAARMSGSRLEQIVSENESAAQTSSYLVNTTCSTDPTGGWDYYCVSSDGSRTLYDVSADRITQRSDLPSYR
jgi:hypothetical protein